MLSLAIGKAFMRLCDRLGAQQHSFYEIKFQGGRPILHRWRMSHRAAAGFTPARCRKSLYT